MESWFGVTNQNKKKHVNYLKQLIFVWVEENEPMKYPNYTNELPIKLIRLWIGSQYYMLI